MLVWPESFYGNRIDNLICKYTDYLITLIGDFPSVLEKIIEQ